jgi:predicted methyltransferase MtxX (methanogen marker protein 4)
MTAGGSIENVPALISVGRRGDLSRQASAERRYKSGLSGEFLAGAGEAF